ncbi:hypothetical protein B0H14DRAFT_3141853 [Mycena olivaceomarginata]|nr:hypothetical protein B0H14DRAFT_3141853 [Mycena olivaceomarginata]
MHFFGGHFRTAPLGLVEEPGAVKYHMTQNNSAIDNAGDSTNSWVNATDISVRWHTCAAMADIIAKAPPGTQVTAHDQAHAFCFSPVVANTSLRTSGNVQRTVADAFVDILEESRLSPKLFKYFQASITTFACGTKSQSRFYQNSQII